MDVAVLVRLVPAAGVAVAVAWLAGRPFGLGAGAAADEVLRALVVGLVVGRLAWVAVDGMEALRASPGTLLLARAGVETWVGAGAAAGWVAWRADPDRRAWLVAAAPAAVLAALAAWHAGCGVEGVCAGRPAAWGVRLPGYLGPVLPASYAEAVVAAGLALVAFRYRTRPALAVGAVAAYALTRGLLGFARAPLTGLPTRDQILSFVAAVVLGAIAWRLRGREAPAGQAPA